MRLCIRAWEADYAQHCCATMTQINSCSGEIRASGVLLIWRNIERNRYAEVYTEGTEQTLGQVSR